MAALGWLLNLGFAAGAVGAATNVIVPHLTHLLRNDMAIKNQSYTVNFLAWDTSNNVGKTGDSGNFTLRIIKDGGTPAAPTNAVSEPDATNLPGVYELVLTASEMNANFVTLGGISSTANISIFPLFITTERGDLATIDTVVDGIQADLDNGTDGLGALSTAIDALPTAAENADAVWDESTTGHTTAGTFGEQVKTDIDAILVDTNELQGDWTNGGRLDLIIDAILDDTGTSGVVLTAAERNAIADAILDRDMSTGTDSGSASVRTVRQALRFNRNKVTISGGTLTVTKEDDTTASWTAAVTTTAGDPITAVDPAS